MEPLNLKMVKKGLLRQNGVDALNEQFDNLYELINYLDGKILDLSSQVSALQSQVFDLEYNNNLSNNIDGTTNM